MQKGHYRYIRKSSFGAYNFGGIGSSSPEIRRKNIQYNFELSIANKTPDTLVRRKAVAFVDEMQRIKNSDWKYYGKPSTYTRDKICYKINMGVYDELFSKEGIFDDWESLIYTLYKPEEENSSIKSTETWDKTAHTIDEIKRKGNLTNLKEIEHLIQRVNAKVEYYNEKYNNEKLISKLLIFGSIAALVLYVLVKVFT